MLNSSSGHQCLTSSFLNQVLSRRFLRQRSKLQIWHFGASITWGRAWQQGKAAGGSITVQVPGGVIEYMLICLLLNNT